jgi:hypothetical protein
VIGSKEFVAEMRTQLHYKLGLKRTKGEYPVAEDGDWCALRALRRSETT